VPPVGDGPGQARHRKRWTLGIGTLVLAAVAAGVSLWATGASGATGYRLSSVSTATVRQTLGVSGTADPVNQGTAAFQVAGTVSAVNVAVGQPVTAGQNLAALDTTSLAQHVSSAQSNLTSAQAKLAEDESSQSSSSSATAASDTSTSGGQSTSVDVTLIALVTSVTSGPSLAQAQQAVVAAQQTADADAATAATALAQAQTACAGSGTTTSTTAPSTTTTTGPTSDPAACTTALGQSLAAQQQVTTDQKAVASAEAALAQVLAATSPSGSTGGSGSSGGSGSAGGSGSSTGSGSTGSSSRSTTGTSGSSSASGSSGTATNSAQQLATDQASIDSATASLIEAQQSLADAQLTSPLSGTVAAVTLAVDQTVTAGSASDAITVINSGSYQATGSLTSSQAAEVKVGDKAMVTVNGLDTSVSGTVTRVGPVDASSSSYTYPLIVVLSGGSHGIAAGSTAQVQVVLHEVDNTRAVPTSAVHTVGNSSYVFVPAAGGEARKKISVGIVGSVYTQVTSGITKGATVVLADLSDAVPSSSTSSSTGGFGGAGFGGGGFGGAGGGGGRFSGGAVGGA
jgi:multidrug efflux pump subunit AcrA (membrane-fusion protein)